MPMSCCELLAFDRRRSRRSCCQTYGRLAEWHATLIYFVLSMNLNTLIHVSIADRVQDPGNPAYS